MEVENRIETFGGQVEELPDELKDRRVSGGSGGNGVILEEDEDSLDSIEGGLEKAQPDGLLPVNGRVIKKVNIKHCIVMDLQMFHNCCDTQSVPVIRVRHGDTDHEHL